MDLFLFQKINNLTGFPFLDKFFVFSADALGYFLIAIFLIIWVIGKKKKIFNYDFLYIPLISAVVSRFVITGLIRFFYNRPRPFEILDVNQLLEHSVGGSFPSGHASFFFALSSAIYFYNKKAGIWFLIGAGLMGFARIYAGIHFPSDILVGALTGIGVSILINLILKRAYTPQDSL